GSKLHQLPRQALAPRRLVTDDGSGRAVAVSPIDRDDARAADDLVLMLDCPEDDGLIARHLVEELLFGLRRRRIAQLDETGHLEVLEPCDHQSRVLRTRRPQPDELAMDDGPVHGPKA